MFDAPQHDRRGLAVAGIDLDRTDLVGSVDRRDLEDLRDHHTVETLSDRGLLLDRHPEVAHHVAERVGVIAERRELVQPTEQDLHRGIL